MARSTRGIPKDIGVFGERQFKETGAALVEVLRVKATTLRKHYKAMRGVVFLVAVVSLDRVRVYFFTNTGLMVSGENMPHSAYEKIRKASRLLAKFEKPKELTPEEKRIEATEELRTAFNKAVKRTARYLGAKEPEFPDIYVTREHSSKTSQSFGVTWQTSGEVTFSEDSLSTQWTEPMLNRAAFVLTLPSQVRSSEIAACIGNAVSLALLRKSKRDTWAEAWKAASKETEWAPFVSHFCQHVDTYQSNHFNWLRQILANSDSPFDMSDLSNVIEAVHDGCVLSLGTEEYHTILGYCKTLNAPRKLTKSKHSLDSVHLNPRILTLPESLGITSDSDVSERDAWARIEFAEGSHVKVLNVLEDDSEPIEEISYVLNLEDAYPSSGGLIAHGKSIVRNAIRMIGLGSQSEYTFEARISKNVSSMNSAEEAVYERLKLGDAEIIMNSLIGSPQHVETLTKNGRVVFLPDFNHLGIFPQYLIHGDYDAVSAAALENSIETTIFKTGESAYALVCAPPTWQSGFVSAVRLSGLSLWPVVSVASSRRLLRCESLHLS